MVIYNIYIYIKPCINNIEINVRRHLHILYTWEIDQVNSKNHILNNSISEEEKEVSVRACMMNYPVYNIINEIVFNTNLLRRKYLFAFFDHLKGIINIII